MTENQALDKLIVVGAEHLDVAQDLVNAYLEQHVGLKNVQIIVEPAAATKKQFEEEAALQSLLETAQEYKLLEPYHGDVMFDDTPFYKKIGQKGGKKRKRRFY